MTFNNNQLSLIRAALVLAEETWKENSEMAEDEGYKRLVIQFKKQVTDANALIQQIDSEEGDHE